MAPRMYNVGTRWRQFSGSHLEPFNAREISDGARCTGQWVDLGAGVDSGVPRNFVRGGEVRQIQLRTEDRENGDLGAVAP